MIAFDEEEEKRIKEIWELYMRVKELILYEEENDPEFKTFIQPHNELRNAFDHMMRILAVKTETIKKNDDEEKRKYIEDQYNSVKGHIICCGFDVMDRTSIILRKKISDEVKPFSSDTILKVMPEYYRTIKPYVEETNQKIAKLRNDVGSTYDVGIKQIDEYVNRIEKLKEYYNQILEKKRFLRKQRKKELKQVYLHILTGAIATIIGGIVLLIIGKFL